MFVHIGEISYERYSNDLLNQRFSFLTPTEVSWIYITVIEAMLQFRAIGLVAKSKKEKQPGKEVITLKTHYEFGPESYSVCTLL